MGSHKLLIKPSAAMELEAVPKKDRQRIVTRMRNLSVEPRPPGCERLSGHDLYRVRRGNCRILYNEQDTDLVVVIVTIGHRREVYR